MLGARTGLTAGLLRAADSRVVAFPAACVEARGLLLVALLDASLVVARLEAPLTNCLPPPRLYRLAPSCNKHLLRAVHELLQTIEVVTREFQRGCRIRG